MSSICNKEIRINYVFFWTFGTYVKYMLGSDAHGFTYFFLHYDWKLI